MTTYKINPTSEVADLLERAADLLESGAVQWTTNTYKRWDLQEDASAVASVCWMGALCEATGEENWIQQDLPDISLQAADAIKPYVIDAVLNLFADDVERARKRHSSHYFKARVAAADEIAGEAAVITFNDRIAEDKSQIIEITKLAAKDLRNQS